MVAVVAERILGLLGLSEDGNGVSHSGSNVKNTEHKSMINQGKEGEAWESHNHKRLDKQKRGVRRLREPRPSCTDNN